MSNPTYDSIWDTIYGEGRALNKYPWDVVVSFVFGNYPRSKDRKDVRIMEIGCGAASNLWFVAREGFQAAGVDGSADAINFAQKRFAAEGLVADLRVADFTQLPFDDDTFDLVIDRGSLVCCGREAAQQAVREIRRVLLPGGRFFCNPYSDTHSSHLAGRPGPDGLTVDVAGGSLSGVGQLCFYGRRQVQELLAGWNILSTKHLEIREERGPDYQIHSEWRVVAEKIA